METKVKQAHTPSPWHVSADGVTITQGGLFTSDQDDIAYINPEVGGRDGFACPEAACANARIMAAAPELLAALVAAAERMEAVAEGIPIHKRHHRVSAATHVAHMAGHLAQHAKLARAAIAKATGEAT